MLVEIKSPLPLRKGPYSRCMAVGREGQGELIIAIWHEEGLLVKPGAADGTGLKVNHVTGCNYLPGDGNVI